MKVLIGVLLICFTAGCSTFKRQTRENWTDFFEPDKVVALAGDCSDYGMDRIEKDLQRLTLLHNEMEDLDREMTALRGRLTAGTTPYLTEYQNKDIEFFLLRFIKVRDTIHDILTYYRGCQSSNPEIHTKGAVLGISAGLRLSYFDSRFVALFFGQKGITRMINAKHPRFEIPGGVELLREGANVLAIEGHNRGSGSSDFTLDPWLAHSLRKNGSPARVRPEREERPDLSIASALVGRSGGGVCPPGCANAFPTAQCAMKNPIVMASTPADRLRRDVR